MDVKKTRVRTRDFVRLPPEPFAVNVSRILSDDFVKRVNEYTAIHFLSMKDKYFCYEYITNNSIDHTYFAKNTSKFIRIN